VTLSLLAVAPDHTFAAGNTPSPEVCTPQPQLLQGLENFHLEQLALPACQTLDEVMLEEARAEYPQVFPPGPVKQRMIFGLVLEGTEDELRAIEATLKGVRPAAWPAQAKNCKTPVCALQGLLGSEELARKVLMFHKRTGYAFSVSIEANQNADGGYLASAWSQHEIREADKLSRLLPPELSHLPGLDKFLRVTDGYRLYDQGPNVAAFTSANFPRLKQEGAIYVYELLADPKQKNNFKGSQFNFTVPALLHEICHNYDFQRMYQTGSTRGYSEVGSWGFWELSVIKPSESTRVPGEPLEGYVSRYAEESPAEDFAESCAAFVLAPAELKRTSPAKYDLIRTKIFSGRDYLDAPWNSSNPNPWDELDREIATAQDQCRNIHASCLKTIRKILPQGTVVYSSLSPEEKIVSDMKLDPCVARSEAGLQKEILARFRNHPELCNHGGLPAVEKRVADLCGPIRKELATITELIATQGTEKAWSICAEHGDYTLECGQRAMLDFIQSQHPMDSNLLPIIEREIAASIDGPSAVLGDLFERHPSGKWISACLLQLEHFEHEDDGTIHYSKTGEAVSNGAVSNRLQSTLIPRWKKDYDSDREMSRWSGEMNAPETGCMQGMQQYFESTGLQMPNPKEASGSYRRALLNGAFQSEWQDFEQAVLVRIQQEISHSSLNRKKKIRQIMETWVAKKPEARAALLDEAFIEHLAKMSR
jgi:hypothetical protein